MNLLPSHTQGFMPFPNTGLYYSSACLNTVACEFHQVVVVYAFFSLILQFRSLFIFSIRRAHPKSSWMAKIITSLRETVSLSLEEPSECAFNLCLNEHSQEYTSNKTDHLSRWIDSLNNVKWQNLKTGINLWINIYICIDLSSWQFYIFFFTIHVH